MKKKRWFSYRDVWIGFLTTLVVNVVLMLVPGIGALVWLWQWIYVLICYFILRLLKRYRMGHGLLLAAGVSVLINTVFYGYGLSGTGV